MLTFILELTKVQIYNNPKLLARKFIDNFLEILLITFKHASAARFSAIFVLRMKTSTSLRTLLLAVALPFLAALIPILVLTLSSGGGPLRKARGPFTAWERTVITQSDSVMYVNVVTDPADSLELRAVCRDLTDEELGSELYATLAAKMLATVQSPQQGGVGIAAPQVGLSLRIAAIQRLDRPGEPFVVYPNLRILEHLGDTVRGPEGCLSIPGKRGIVPRSEGVVIGWTDPRTLESVTEELHGYVAIIFQHETDHLDGILYTDRAESVSDDPDWDAERAPYAAQGAYVKPAWRCTR